MDLQGQEGLLTTFRSGWRTGGALAYAIAALLLSFYLLLYFRDEAVALAPWLDLDRAAHAVGLRSRWLFYGLIYSVAMIGGGIAYLRKHGTSRYHRVRIAVNITVQLVLAFLLPLVMPLFLTDDPNEYWKYERYLSYLWPLAWYDFHPDILEAVPVVAAVYAVVAALIAAPVLAYFFGKRWYCSWVCGCGGLANTFGDPWRHLTSASERSWRFEKVAVHTVLVLAVVSTLLLFVDHYALRDNETFHTAVAGGGVFSVKRLYGLVIGSILAGVVGVGFYPLFGPRVWCRNFCPMAALLGLVQKLGRFRIEVKPDMCISCGNCTTYCEMGIDVRSYAEKNESFTRASCVGCGQCAHVCPRGVLQLTSESPKARVRLPVVGG